jgi:hypothetical protein
MARNQKAKKLQPNYAKNKRAFDAVMKALRGFGTPTVGPVGAVNPERGGGKPAARNPAKPSMVDFRCDVFLAIKSAIPKDVDMVEFHLAYTLYDSEDEVERGVHAESILHGRCHSVEQRLGAEFIKRKLFPVQGKGYFYAPRIERPR